MKIYAKLTHLRLKVIIAIIIALFESYYVVRFGNSTYITVLILAIMLSGVMSKCEKYEKALVTLPVGVEKINYYKMKSMMIILFSYGVTSFVASAIFGGILAAEEYFIMRPDWAILVWLQITSAAWLDIWMIVMLLLLAELVFCLLKKRNINAEKVRVVVYGYLVLKIAQGKWLLYLLNSDGFKRESIRNLIVGTIFCLLSVYIWKCIRKHLNMYYMDIENSKSTKQKKKSNVIVTVCDAIAYPIRLVGIKIKENKRIILSVLAVCIIVFVVLEINSRILSPKDKEMYKILVAGEWGGKNGGDSATIYFSEDKDFGYYCSCGDPVDNFDLYDKYVFKKNGEIEVYGFFTKDTLKIKSISYEKMELEVNGEIREFHR